MTSEKETAGGKLRLVAAAVIVLLAVLFTADGAKGYALTSLKNVGTKQFRVELDNGHQVYIQPGQTLWGVQSVMTNYNAITGKGQCIDIDPGPDVCYPVGRVLGLDFYLGRVL